jgi:hypothetical protein
MKSKTVFVCIITSYKAQIFITRGNLKKVYVQPFHMRSGSSLEERLRVVTELISSSSWR